MAKETQVLPTLCNRHQGHQVYANYIHFLTMVCHGRACFMRNREKITRYFVCHIFTNFKLLYLRSAQNSHFCILQLNSHQITLRQPERKSTIFSKRSAHENHPNFLKSLGHRPRPRPRPWVILILSNGLESTKFGSNSCNECKILQQLCLK